MYLTDGTLQLFVRREENIESTLLPTTLAYTEYLRIKLLGEDAKNYDESCQGNVLMDSGSKLTFELTSVFNFLALVAVLGTIKCLGHIQKI